MTTKYGYSIIDDVNFLIRHIPKIFESSSSKKSRARLVSRLQKDSLDGKEVDYEYFNHHVLRAAVSRVIGLVKILELESKGVKQTELIYKLHKSCEELEKVMNEASTLFTADLQK